MSQSNEQYPFVEHDANAAYFGGNVGEKCRVTWDCNKNPVMINYADGTCETRAYIRRDDPFGNDIIVRTFFDALDNFIETVID